MVRRFYIPCENPVYAGEVILEKITIDDVPRGLRERVKAYLVEMGYIDAQ